MNRPFQKLCRQLVLSALLACAFAHALLPQANAESVKATVISVQDGDSITVMQADKPEKIILYGIDCPELKQAFGKEAREFTSNNCLAKSVKIESKGHDRNGRTIARVFLEDGSELNQELVKRGLAWWSDKYAANEEILKNLHKKAKEDKLGLWSDSQPIAPWIFRNGEKSVKAVIRPAK